MSNTAIILFAHGARDPQWAVPFRQLATQLAARRPDCAIGLAFLELMQPSLADCVGTLVADGAQRCLIVPAFMASGAHLRRDLPLLLDELRGQYPHIAFELTAALGEAMPVQAAMADWIASL